MMELQMISRLSHLVSRVGWIDTEGRHVDGDGRAGLLEVQRQRGHDAGKEETLVWNSDHKSQQRS